MQSSSTRCDTSYISLGERRGKSDLARFSLDLSWAREVSESARVRAYPSPPMSGSPPRHNLDSSDRSHGSYGSSGPDTFRGMQPPQLEHAADQRAQPGRAFAPEQPASMSFPLFRMDMPAGQLQYQAQPLMTPQQQHQSFPQHPTPAPGPIGHAADYTSPRSQRKTKGHVASACVPCKRAHLRCDAQRPCSRCVLNGKEDTCVDVQHKKRGRPRLRDERETRYDNMGPGFAHAPPEASMRRPVSFYGPGEPPVGTPFGDSLQRTGSYRVLKSQGPGPGTGSMVGAIPPQYLEQAVQNANIYGAIQPATRILPSQEPICAYLTMDFQFAKSTQSFSDTVGIPSIGSRKLQDVVIGSDIEKVVKLQRTFDDERRDKEPNYLPPIYLKFEEERVIQMVGYGPDELGQVKLDKQETFTFQGLDGQQRSFHARLGLGKKDSTYFLAMVLIPPPPPTHAYMAATPYPREGFHREQQYGFQPPSQQPYMPAGPSSFGHPPGYDVGMTAYRPQGPLSSNIPPSANIQPYQPPRQDYQQHQPQQYQVPPPQAQYQGPPSQSQYPTPSGIQPGHSLPQRDLQLPPIRDPRGESSMTFGRRDDRSSRVDIGGLIEKPDSARRV